ncbi:YnbE family lipoprotein [Sneathiella sp. P13V-1]|uniref:YnbE family lipoprotein n=1 Tax=Sneathiella sp. P13V-1 TaxID=2697366 RepID=UPI00187B796B|nr:YnbE family lipoprotein [Sneathiella sp. P13V-1]MBE7638649.1 YnbE family lipoprotein [Sneathiella sp. P13V-1]
MNIGHEVTVSDTIARLCLVSGLALVLQACSPTVKVETPSEPITINLNIKLDAEVKLKIEEQANDDIENNSEIF